MVTYRALLSLGAIIALGSSSSVAAQDVNASVLPTVIEGFTVEVSTRVPYPNVQIRFDTGERVVSDERGRYSLTGVPAGLHQVALITGRCNVTFAEVELAPGEIKGVAFTVPPDPVGLRAGHEELRKRSEGDYYSAEELERMNVRDLLEALRRVAPDMVGPQGGLPGAGASLRGRTRSAQGVSVPIVVVDGIQVGDGVRTLRDFKPIDIYSMEVLKGASRGWAYGTGGAGGVIKISTRQGDFGYGITDHDQCEIGEWPDQGVRAQH
ncbi:MAG: TonB-dependent receptor [Gemmatimonadota bacterium]|nr:TonB-dependent receptor [Gemmatimonadota bacterium]